MAVIYSWDSESMRLSDLEFVVEREYLGESIGRFLLRGQAPEEFARHLFADTTGSPNAGLMHFPELGITDTASLSAAIEKLIAGKSLILVAAWPAAEGQLFDAEGQLLQAIRISDPQPDAEAWRVRADENLVKAGFVRAAPWDDSGTRVVPIEPSSP